jgi:N-acetylglucosamine kinase-like BadF-type ATPase
MTPGGVLAIDAGNSKTDVALVAADGRLLGRARGPGFRPHVIGAQDAIIGLEPLLAHLGLPLGQGPQVAHVSACLANADLPVELEAMEHQIEARAWGLTSYVGNDTFALLRMGVERPPGVAVVCGAGINCSGIAADGRTARFAALGKISGDWGGGGFLAEEALWCASRSVDGRGPKTSLARLLPLFFGTADVPALVEALHLGTISADRLHEAAPVLFAAAADGDPVAASVVRRQAKEVVALAVSALRRLDLLEEPVDVILGGGVLTAGHALLLNSIDEGLALGAPKARARVVGSPPVLGAALLGLDAIAAPPDAKARLVAELTR